MRWLRRLHRLELRRLLGSLGSLGPLGSGTGLALGLARWRPGSEQAGCQEAAQHSFPRVILDPRNSSYRRCVVSSRRRHQRTGVLICCTEKHDTAHGTRHRCARCERISSLVPPSRCQPACHRTGTEGGDREQLQQIRYPARSSGPRPSVPPSRPRTKSTTRTADTRGTGVLARRVVC